MLNLKVAIICTVIICRSIDCIAQAEGPSGQLVEAKDTSISVRTTGKVHLANRGFAPISAFSFNSPIIIGSLSIKKKQFSYEPDVSFGLNGKPWIISNWFRLNYVNRKKLMLKLGANPGLFFRTERNSSGEETIQVQRNLNVELGSEFRFSSNWSLGLTYLHNTACDPGGLSGHYLDVSNYFPDIPLSKTIVVNIKPQLFYFDFDGDIDGLFTSSVVHLMHKSIPISFYCQGVVPLWANFSGNTFKWNAGLVFDF